MAEYIEDMKKQGKAIPTRGAVYLRCERCGDVVRLYRFFKSFQVICSSDAAAFAKFLEDHKNCFMGQKVDGCQYPAVQIPIPDLRLLVDVDGGREEEGVRSG